MEYNNFIAFFEKNTWGRKTMRKMIEMSQLLPE